jgi:hypothetical protein
MPDSSQVDQVLKAKAIWRVSAMALAHRFHGLDLLSDWQYRFTCRQLAELGYRRGEPVGIARETSQVLPKIFVLLRKKGQHPRGVAEELHMPLAELNGLMFGLYFTSRQGERADSTSSLDKPVLRIVSGGDGQGNRVEAIPLTAALELIE